MSATPFRSHLLQQWSRSSQGHAPAAVVPWLRATPPPQRSTIDEDEDDNGLSRRQRRPARRNHRHHSSATSSTSTSTRPSTRTRTSTSTSGNRSSHRAMPPSLSTVDSAAISWAASSSSASTILIPPPMSPPARHRHMHMTTTPIRRSATSRFFASSVTSSPSSDSSFDEGVEDADTGASASADTNHAGVGDNETDDDVDVDDDNAFHYNTTAAMLQSLLQTRRTATRLKHDDTATATATTSIIDETRLRQALHRAVACAQMAPNHKRTEPFSFRRFLAGSSTAARLAEISYQVTLRKTDSISNAASKRQKWLDIPAFLVALVHENQPPGSLPYLPRNTTGSTNNSTAAAAAAAAAAEEEEEEGSSDDYRPLPYLPPASERQLEDYAASSAAVQNVLLSLHAEGIGSKWATGPVIHTPAFRQMVHAKPTDRIAALIMLGGSTDFANEREDRRTQARRTRRRSIGDLLTDLP